MTYVNRGEVETVQKAVDFIRICNAGVKKPVITPRNRFFQFPEMAARVREKMQASRQEENSEILLKEAGWCGTDRPTGYRFFRRHPRRCQTQGAEVERLPLVPQEQGVATAADHECSAGGKRMLNLQDV